MFYFCWKSNTTTKLFEVFALIRIITSLLSYFDTINTRPVWLVVLNNGNGNDLLCNFIKSSMLFP